MQDSAFSPQVHPEVRSVAHACVEGLCILTF
ncbi:hypothetical protein XHV734_1200 [Xanthomonas hortorum pv. vitians]|nr:hypothetical protein XHV734_1200 [Xanthomonas hortorum pv. vitians]